MTSIPNYALALSNLGLACFSKENDIESAKIYLLKARDLYKELNLIQHPNYIDITANYANLLRRDGLYKEALSILDEIGFLKLADTSFTSTKASVYSPDTITGMLRVAALIDAGVGMSIHAKSLMDQIETFNDQILEQVFSVSSESQRLKYIKHLRLDWVFYLSLLLKQLQDSKCGKNRVRLNTSS